MQTEEQKARFKTNFSERMNADFLPNFDPANVTASSEQNRQTAALEYIAGQLGIIRRFLEQDKA
jgi:hypothetical protein